MSPAKQLLESLVDPDDKGSLFWIASENIMYNPRAKRSYPVVRDIPVMLMSDATDVSDAEHSRLMKLVQRDELKPTGGGR